MTGGLSREEVRERAFRDAEPDDWSSPLRIFLAGSLSVLSLAGVLVLAGLTAGWLVAPVELLVLALPISFVVGLSVPAELMKFAWWTGLTILVAGPVLIQIAHSGPDATVLLVFTSIGVPFLVLPFIAPLLFFGFGVGRSLRKRSGRKGRRRAL